jgi:hypothetical protein
MHCEGVNLGWKSIFVRLVRRVETQKKFVRDGAASS